jgi:hypothetical protein
MARYTMFEHATQHGFVTALMAPRMKKSRDAARIVVDQDRGRVFQLIKQLDPETPVFEFVIPDRTPQESVKLWEDRCRTMLDKAWNKYEKARKAARAGLGEGSLEPSPPTGSPITPSSTDPLTSKGSSPIEAALEASAPSGSALDDLAPDSSGTIPGSSLTFEPQ